MIIIIEIAHYVFYEQLWEEHIFYDVMQEEVMAATHLCCIFEMLYVLICSTILEFDKTILMVFLRIDMIKVCMQIKDSTTS